MTLIFRTYYIHFVFILLRLSVWLTTGALHPFRFHHCKDHGFFRCWVFMLSMSVLFCFFIGSLRTARTVSWLFFLLSFEICYVQNKVGCSVFLVTETGVGVIVPYSSLGLTWKSSQNPRDYGDVPSSLFRFIPPTSHLSFTEYSSHVLFVPQT